MSYKLQEVLQRRERDGFGAIVGAKFCENFLYVVPNREPADVKLFADGRRAHPFGY